MGILYRPADGVAADCIPFYWKGDYHLFFLKDYRDPVGHGEGTPWWHLVTKDFVNFRDLGEALPRGPIGSQDVWVFTGSVIERKGTFHIFYTGHNHHLKHIGKPVQGVLHATSPNLKTWTKDSDFMFFAPRDMGYEPDDWRDPFVYWDERYRAYGMLLAARRTVGPPRNRGCVAMATSKDLGEWKVREPFWAPDEYFTHECPDLFRMGEWWYLVYSTFSERCVTHYRMSRSLSGPWLAPPNDTFDGRAYYAAKTAGDGKRRFVFGWLPTRDGNKDDGGWQWGGELVAHEIVQQGDGTLTVCIPDTVHAAFNKAFGRREKPVRILGRWDIAESRIGCNSPGRVSALSLGAMPPECLIEANVTFRQGTAGCGLLLRADRNMDRYYQIRLEPFNRRIVVDRWSRPGDQPFMLERPLSARPDAAVKFRIIVDGTNLVVYADDRVALSCRMYEQREGNLGLFVTEGRAVFENLTVRVRR